jgi:hypothetical protein
VDCLCPFFQFFSLLFLTDTPIKDGHVFQKLDELLAFFFSDEDLLPGGQGKAIETLSLVIFRLDPAEIRQPFCRLFLECIIFVGKTLIRGQKAPVVLFRLSPSPPFDEKFRIIPQAFIPFNIARPTLLLLNGK